MGKRNKVEDDRAAGELASGATSCLPEILREILSRVLYRSLCRFTYVRASMSKAWLALCSDLAVRTAGGRSPQTTLSGFFSLKEGGHACMHEQLDRPTTWCARQVQPRDGGGLGGTAHSSYEIQRVRCSSETGPGSGPQCTANGAKP
ncbi:F-box protein [Hordeum vulgare]|nr:F-box protein [Hordeum vulgare]